MNALQQRRLTPLLLLACLLLGALLICLANGWGRSPRWETPLPVPPLAPKTPMPAAPQVTPLASFAAIWQRPLFNPERRPAPPVKTEPVDSSLSGLELTGTLLTGLLQVALLHDPVDNKDVRIHLDGHYKGWRLTTLAPRRAVFAKADQVVELVLPALQMQPHGEGAHPMARSGEEGDALQGAASKSVRAAGSGRGYMAVPAVPGRQDDTEDRRVQLDALKRAVLDRRRQASPATGAQ